MFKDTNGKHRQQWVIFVIVALIYMFWLHNIGSMISNSVDAQECWHSITTWFTSNRYGSYTLYKGIASIYPYVWLYHLAVCLHLNEFFFCMLYHALLFAYITTIGIPNVVEQMTGWRPVLFQRIILPLFLFIIWKPTNALTELMVDLPSCAFFIMAAENVMSLLKTRHRIFKIGFSGFLIGLCSNISGQYAVSGLFLFGASFYQILFQKEKVKNKAGQILLLVVCYSLMKAGNAIFWMRAVQPLIARGAWIPSGSVWLNRGLLYFLDKNRYLYGTTLTNPRGVAILQDMYAFSLEDAQNMLDMAGRGEMGWTVSQFFFMLLKYPVDVIVQACDKFFLSFSIDMRRQSTMFLLMGYSLVYISAWNAIRYINKWKDILSLNTCIVLAALCSLIPTMVMTLEVRVAIGAQSVIFGSALMSASIPKTLESIVYILSKGKVGKEYPRCIASVYVVWFLFIIFCMMHMGTLYAQSNIGTEMLFKW